MVAAGASEYVTSTLQSFLDVDPSDPRFAKVKLNFAVFEFEVAAFSMNE